MPLPPIGIDGPIALQKTLVSKLAAVKAGIGLSAIPKRIVPPDLVAAREYYLPDLPPIKSLLCARLGLETEKAANLIKQLSMLFFDRSDSQ